MDLANLPHRPLFSSSTGPAGPLAALPCRRRPVYCQGRSRRPLPRELRRPRQPPRPHPLAQRLVRQGPCHRRRQALHVQGIHGQRGVAHHLRQAGGGRADHRRAAGHGLQHRQPKALVERGKDEEPRARIDGGQIAPPISSGELDLSIRPSRSASSLACGKARVPVPGDHQPGAGRLPAARRRCARPAPAAPGSCAACCWPGTGRRAAARPRRSTAACTTSASGCGRKPASTAKGVTAMRPGATP